MATKSNNKSVFANEIKNAKNAFANTRGFIKHICTDDDNDYPAILDALKIKKNANKELREKARELLEANWKYARIIKLGTDAQANAAIEVAEPVLFTAAVKVGVVQYYRYVSCRDTRGNIKIDFFLKAVEQALTVIDKNREISKLKNDIAKAWAELEGETRRGAIIPTIARIRALEIDTRRVSDAGIGKYYHVDGTSVTDAELTAIELHIEKERELSKTVAEYRKSLRKGDTVGVAIGK